MGRNPAGRGGLQERRPDVTCRRTHMVAGHSKGRRNLFIVGAPRHHGGLHVLGHVPAPRTSPLLKIWHFGLSFRIEKSTTRSTTCINRSLPAPLIDARLLPTHSRMT